MHDPKKLLFFLEILERGSMTAAARARGISRSTAARHLAELEDELGVQLLQRTTRQLALTQAAKADPDWAEPWRHLAEVLHARGRMAQAYAVAERALEPDPFDRGLRAIYELGELEVDDSVKRLFDLVFGPR